MPLNDGAIFAGFTIVRLLGSGGMGEVYLAQHPRLPRRNALKVLPADVSADPEYRARFNREADLASTLWHPHIVSVHDRGEYNGQLWISMDYIDGQDAARLLADRYPAGMPIEQVVRIVTSVASALDYAHKQGLLHRDVKPANIMLTHRDDDGEQRILLTDFGIARDVNEVSGLTATNMTMGTVAYSAPEQLMGLELDGRADQYALAASAYHLLTGVQPFPHSNPAVVITHHLNADPPRASDIHAELARLDGVLGKALAKDPRDRFHRCLDFADALEHAAFADDADHHAARTMLAPLTSTTRPRLDAVNTCEDTSRGSSPRMEVDAAGKRWIYVAPVIAMVLLLIGLVVTWRPWQANDAATGNTASPPSKSVSLPSAPASSQPDQSGTQPRTLEAATLALQESADRLTAGDFAGVWELYFAKLRERITQADFVTYNEACKETGWPITVTGVRMDGPDIAILRESIFGVGFTKTMTYEDGSWKLVTEDTRWLENLGLPVDQLIAEERAAGKCDKEPQP